MAVLGLAACTEAAESPAPSADTAAADPSASSPADQEPTPPATSSGPLSIAAFPEPEALGPGWDYRVDPGDAEAGYVGNGTPGQARDPQEVTALVVPLGCPRPRLQTPDHAFEVAYSWRGRAAVAVRLEFPDAESSRSFYRERLRALRDCAGRSGGPAVGPLVSRVEPTSGTAVLSERTPESDGWTELAVHRGTGLLLLATPTPFGRPPLRLRDADHIERLLGETT